MITRKGEKERERRRKRTNQTLLSYNNGSTRKSKNTFKVYYN